MLDVLQNLIKQAGQGAVVDNPQVPNEHNESVMQTVMDGVMGGLQQQAGGSNLGGLLSVLTGGAGQGSGMMQNPMVAGIAQQVIGSLMSKFGLSDSAAGSVVAGMLPQVLGGLASKANDPNDSSVDLGGIMNVLSGGKTNGIDFGSVVGQLGNVMADGKLDMSDLMNLAGSAMGGGQQQGAGGIMGVLGGLFGKK